MDSPTAALKADRSGGRRLRVRRRRRRQALPAQAGVVLGMVALLIAWYGVVDDMFWMSFMNAAPTSPPSRCPPPTAPR